MSEGEAGPSPRCGVHRSRASVRVRSTQKYSSAEGDGTCSVPVDDTLDGSAGGLQNDLILGLLQQITESSGEGEVQTALDHQNTDAQASPATTVKVKSEVVGPTTEELDSFNELIKFDHVYYKPAVSTQVASHSLGMAAATTATSPSEATPSPAKKAGVSLLKPSVRAATHNQVTPVPEVKQEPVITELSLGEADLAGLSAKLEELIDLDALLQEDLLSDSISSSQSLNTATIDTAPISSVDRPAPLKRKLQDIEESPSKKSIHVKTESGDDVFSGNDLSHLFPSSDTFGLDAGLSPSLSPGARSSLTESGYSSDLSDIGSPKSDTSGGLGGEASMWEESFSELFPSLI